MKILVVPDVHLKCWLIDSIKDIALKNKVDEVVFLGDYVDDWNCEFKLSQYRLTFRRMVVLYNHLMNSKIVTHFIIGNHDYAYLAGLECSGNSPLREQVKEYLQKFDDDIEGLELYYIRDDVIFSHGGISEWFLSQQKKVNPELEFRHDYYPSNILWNDSSPLWERSLYSKDKMVENFQVVGHTPVERVQMIDNILYTDVFSTKPNKKQIGESTLAIIDTEKRVYREIKF